MSADDPTRWLHSAGPADGARAAGCGACPSADADSTCKAAPPAQPCEHPQLSGPSERVAWLLRELDRHVVDAAAGRGIVELGWVKGLRVEPGEVELTLGLAPACGGGRMLTDAAFHHLRGLLPDTDIYVSHRP
jgi:hypothetical protein